MQSSIESLSHSAESNYHSYIANLQKANLPKYTIQVAEESIQEYLKQLKTIPNGEQFSQPAKIDPYTQKEFGSDKVLIAEWEKRHIKYGKKFAKKFASNAQAGLGGLNFITGPMYASKTDIMLSTILNLVNSNWQGRVHPFVASNMDEPKIFTRIGNRPDSPLTVTKEIKAIPVNGSSLLSKLEEGEFNPGDVILIEEISFVSFDSLQCQQIWQTLQKLSEHGVTVICSGLNTDYRAIELPMYVAAKENNIKQVLCNAFYSYVDEDGLIKSGGGVKKNEVLQKTYTTRYDTTSGFPDILMPVPISRQNGLLTNYLSVPEDVHFFLVLKKVNPDLYAQLLQVGGSQELLDYNKKLAGLA